MSDTNYLAHLPTSRARTAYDLCLDVAKAIEEEPLRYRQTCWLQHGKESLEKLNQGEPQCGTVGCRAGWMSTLLWHNRLGDLELEKALVKATTNPYNNRMAEFQAYRILAKVTEGNELPKGFQRAVNDLFDENALQSEMAARDDMDYEDAESELEDIDKGSRKYAHLGALGLREFAERWKEWLQSRRLSDVELVL